jgi:hypothetical protein
MLPFLSIIFNYTLRWFYVFFEHSDITVIAQIHQETDG